MTDPSYTHPSDLNGSTGEVKDCMVARLRHEWDGYRDGWRNDPPAPCPNCGRMMSSYSSLRLVGGTLQHEECEKPSLGA